MKIYVVHQIWENYPVYDGTYIHLEGAKSYCNMMIMSRIDDETPKISWMSQEEIETDQWLTGELFLMAVPEGVKAVAMDHGLYMITADDIDPSEG